MIHGSDTPRTDLATYLRCLLEAVRRMLGGRWGFLMRPVAGLLMGREARQALLQAAAAFEQLAVLLEQFRAGTLVPETAAVQHPGQDPSPRPPGSSPVDAQVRDSPSP